MSEPESCQEWRIVCADGVIDDAPRDEKPSHEIDEWDASCPCGGPHRVEVRTVTYGPWEDAR